MDKYCERCYARDAKPCMECSTCNPGHRNFRPALVSPPTNADRIRAMSDDELAAMLLDWQMNDQTANWCTDEQGCAGRGEGFECTDEKEAACIVRWLREPAGGAI